MVRDDSLPPTGPGLPGHVDAKGKPSIVPKFREIRKNFIIGLYNSQASSPHPILTQSSPNPRLIFSQEDIDTDDGSSYYQTHDNYFAMGAHLLHFILKFPLIYIGFYIMKCIKLIADHGLKSDFAGQWNHHWNNICKDTGGNLSASCESKV
jgi:hypothetical protein